MLHKLCKEPLVEGWRFALSVMVIDYLQVRWEAFTRISVLEGVSIAAMHQIFKLM